jgi:hypothetical protein
MTTVTASTSLILVTTSNNTGPYAVNFPNISTTGRIITVRDNDGFASTSNAIVLQAISGATFQGISGSLTINQPFGFITLNSQANGVYGILNTFAFPAGSTTANVSNVVASNVTANTLQTSTILVQSTVQLRDRATGVYNSLYASSGQLILNNSFVGQVSAADLTSTVTGLGTAGYLSTVPLFASTQSISSLQTNFLSAGSMTVGSFNPALINTSLVITSVLSAGLTNISSLRTNARRIALGSNAATAGTAQGIDSVAIGTAAGNQSQGPTAVAIGSSAGTTSQSQNSVAIGTSAGATIQGANSVAVGPQAGLFQQGASAVAVGDIAGTWLQGTRSVAVGIGAGSNSQGVSAVALGDAAGYSAQGTGSVAIGQGASYGAQGADAVSIGHDTGQNSQGTQSVAIGYSAAKNSQGTNAVAIGLNAGSNIQGGNAIAIGANAGSVSQGGNAIAIGINAAATSQGINGIAIGNGAADISAQGQNAIAIGSSAGKVAQGAGALSFGNNAGFSNQGVASIAFGSNAGSNFQNLNSIAVGIFAGSNRQGSNAIAIGTNAGSQLQSTGSIAIGFTAGQTNQNSNAVAMGFAAGNATQGSSAVAIGDSAASNAQGQNAVAIGNQAGASSQGINSVAIGLNAGTASQNTNAVAIGSFAGLNGQGRNAIAIGINTGVTSQGSNAIAIGAFAGQTTQTTNTILLNATGAALNTTTTNATYIKPIRQNLDLNSNMGVLYYTSTTGELTYGPTLLSTFSTLDVAGTAYVAGDFYTSNVIHGLNGGVIRLVGFLGENYIQSGSNTSSGSGTKLHFAQMKTTNTTMTINTSTYQVGINNTNPQYSMDVNGTLNVVGIVQNSNGYFSGINESQYITLNTANRPIAVTAQGTGMYIFRPDNNDSRVNINTRNNGTLLSSFTVSQLGYVGINNPNPQYQLDVNGTLHTIGETRLYSDVQIYDTSAPSMVGAIRMTTFVGQSYIQSGSNGAQPKNKLFFTPWASTTPVCTMDMVNSNVGINTATPAYTLDVNGDIGLSNQSQTALMIYKTGGGASYIQSGSNGTLGSANKLYFTSIGSSAQVMTLDHVNGRVGINNTTSPAYTLDVNGTGRFTGALTKGGGSFEIQHPVLKNSTLVHSFIEGPRCDLIYRGKKQLSSGIAVIDLEKESTGNGSTMAPGTFVALCTNPQTYLQNNQTFDRVIGSVSANILTIRSENHDSKAAIDWMVIAERHDPFIKTWDRTDSNGLLILEHAKV